jgi:hypothetical protein
VHQYHQRQLARRRKEIILKAQSPPSTPINLPKSEKNILQTNTQQPPSSSPPTPSSRHCRCGLQCHYNPFPTSRSSTSTLGAGPDSATIRVTRFHLPTSSHLPSLVRTHSKHSIPLIIKVATSIFFDKFSILFQGVDKPLAPPSDHCYL